MIDNTINDAKTIAASGKGAILARSLRCLYSFNIMFPVRDALRHTLNWACYRSLLGISNSIACGGFRNLVQRTVAQSACRSTTCGKAVEAA